MDNNYMRNRVWGLTQIGKFLGKDAMLAQVKPEEKEDLKDYLYRYYLNTHGVSQEAEMKAWGYLQEGAEFGWEYINALRDSLR